MISISAIWLVGGSTKIKPDPLAVFTATCAIPLNGTGPIFEKQRITFPVANLLVQFSIIQILKMAKSLDGLIFTMKIIYLCKNTPYWKREIERYTH